jgi:hypothetical protein
LLASRASLLFRVAILIATSAAIAASFIAAISGFFIGSCNRKRAAGRPL